MLNVFICVYIMNVYMGFKICGFGCWVLFNYLFLKIRMINLKMSNFKIIFVYCIKENY